MKLIDAESLQAAGWTLERTCPVDSQTMLWEKKKPAEVDEAVVRCNNCKYYKHKTCTRFGIQITRKADDFCSEGVRKSAN